MGAPTERLKKKEVEAKQPVGKHASARGLEGAYSDDEPEYTLDMLIAVNPDYKGSGEKCNATSCLPARGLEGAYSDDEPEYTLDMLIAVNPDYKGSGEKCNATPRASARGDESECTIDKETQ